MFKRVKPSVFLMALVGLAACQAISVFVTFSAMSGKFDTIAYLPFLAVAAFLIRSLNEKGADVGADQLSAEKLSRYRRYNLLTRSALLIGVVALGVFAFSDNHDLPVRLYIFGFMFVDAIMALGIIPCLLSSRIIGPRLPPA